MTTETDASRRDAVFAENQRLRQECAELRAVLAHLVSEPLRYNDSRIEIDCKDHAAAMERVRRARAILSRSAP